jgi:hypothetical protein
MFYVIPTVFDQVTLHTNLQFVFIVKWSVYFLLQLRFLLKKLRTQCTDAERSSKPGRRLYKRDPYTSLLHENCEISADFSISLETH